MLVWRLRSVPVFRLVLRRVPAGAAWSMNENCINGRLALFCGSL